MIADKLIELGNHKVKGLFEESEIILLDSFTMSITSMLWKCLWLRLTRQRDLGVVRHAQQNFL